MRSHTLCNQRPGQDLRGTRLRSGTRYECVAWAPRNQSSYRGQLVITPQLPKYFWPFIGVSCTYNPQLPYIFLAIYRGQLVITPQLPLLFFWAIYRGQLVITPQLPIYFRPVSYNPPSYLHIFGHFYGLVIACYNHQLPTYFRPFDKGYNNFIQNYQGHTLYREGLVDTVVIATHPQSNNCTDFFSGGFSSPKIKILDIHISLYIILP